MKRLISTATAIALAVTAGVAHGQVAEKKAMTLDAAKHVIAAAAAEAKRLNAGGAIAVVDEGGSLVALERLEKTFAAAANISIGKARTAAIFQRPTKLFEDIVNKGRTTMVALPDFIPLQGGVPIVVEGQVIGAVGVSGAASAQQDEDIALVAAKAVKASIVKASARNEVTHLATDRVAAAFAKGMPLLEVGEYKIHASRRDAPGVAEVHDWETDVIYVLDGSATLITGGTMVEGKITEPGQIRGPEIKGGVSRQLVKGDVVVIPEGVPHWFKEVQAPFLYFVVKPITANGVGK